GVVLDLRVQFPLNGPAVHLQFVGLGPKGLRGDRAGRFGGKSAEAIEGKACQTDGPSHAWLHGAVVSLVPPVVVNEVLAAPGHKGNRENDVLVESSVAAAFDQWTAVVDRVRHPFDAVPAGDEVGVHNVA